MLARIKEEDLKPEFEELSRKHKQLQALVVSGRSSSEWASEARNLMHKLTELLRKVNTRSPLTSQERLFLADVKAQVLNYLSFWDRQLNKRL